MAPTYLSGYQGNFAPGASASIANGAQNSSVIPTGGMALTGIFMPSAFTGTALTFLAAPASDGTFVPVTKSDGSAVSYTVAASKYVAIDPKDFQGIPFLKIVSGSAEGGVRSLTCTLKGF